jgi:hypothetical protein
MPEWPDQGLTAKSETAGEIKAMPSAARHRHGA